MGIYDLPASINYISNLINDRVIYIGHSQGTTQFFVMAAELPNFAVEKIKVSLILAPVVFMSHITSPLRLLASESIMFKVEVSLRK